MSARTDAEIIGDLERALASASPEQRPRIEAWLRARLGAAEVTFSPAPLPPGHVLVPCSSPPQAPRPLPPVGDGAWWDSPQLTCNVREPGSLVVVGDNGAIQVAFREVSLASTPRPHG